MQRMLLLIAAILIVGSAQLVHAEDPAGPDVPSAKPESQPAGVTSSAAPAPAATPAPKPADSDPTKNEVSLPAGPGWNASLVIDNGDVGIWTVKSFQVFDQLACPEVIGVDNKGRCHVMMSYSGKWTPLTIIHDGKWLGGLTHGDVDPRFEGAEVYTGSQRGHLYQILAYRETVLDCRLIARLPGREIHTILAGDLDPRTEGQELLVFTRPGGLYRVTPNGADGRFVVTHLADLPGRIRDAVVLPGAGPATVATVSRTGKLRLLRIMKTGPVWEDVYQAPMGMGRLAVAPRRAGRGLVLYSTHDDGRILRHARTGDASWDTEVIYRGPQGPRGIAAGRFHADPDVETIAIFGYSKKVEVLSRRPTGWSSEVIFEDRDKGHWLSAAEVDGRNATDELVASGYGARIVLLSRPSGYGIDNAQPATRTAKTKAGRHP